MLFYMLAIEVRAGGIASRLCIEGIADAGRVAGVWSIVVEITPGVGSRAMVLTSKLLQEV